MSHRLQGKVAVITGAVSGMGLAACELFVAEGAKVVVADVQEAKGIALERRLGDAVSFIRCDVRSEETCGPPSRAPSPSSAVWM